MTRHLGLCIGLCVLAAIAPLAARAAGVDAGVKGGVNMSDLNVENTTDPEDSRSGMAAGAWVGLAVTNMFSIQPEALFMMKGDQGRDVVDGTEVTVTAKLDYVQVPVLAKLALAPEATVRPTLFAGPTVGINTSSKLSAKGENEDASAEVEVNLKDDTKPIEMGVVFGGGLEFPFGDSAQSFGVEARYDLGLTNVVDNPDTGGETRTRTLSILGTYGFL